MSAKAGNIVETAEVQQESARHGTQIASEPASGGNEFLHEGGIGKIHTGEGAFATEWRPAIGTSQTVRRTAEGVNYNLWLGPAPKRAFNPNRFHYNWHWHWDYGNGDIGNQGVHQMDVARWGLGKSTLPKTVFSSGGRLGYDDDGETPNTQISIMEYDDCQLVFEVRIAVER